MWVALHLDAVLDGMDLQELESALRLLTDSCKQVFPDQELVDFVNENDTRLDALAQRSRTNDFRYYAVVT